MSTQLKSLAALLKHRIAMREDSEFPQAVLRLVMVCVMLAYFATPYFRAHVDSSIIEKIYYLNAISIVICLFFIIAPLVYTEQSPTRRRIALLHDTSFISIALLLGQTYTAPFSVLYLWITVGNGFRYGVQYLFASLVSALVGFTLVIYVSDYWRENTLISITVFAMLIMIPPYVALLLRSLHHANTQIKLQAMHDPLVPIYNRRGFSDAFNQSIRQNDNENFHHVLFYCDLDGFKQVNDSAKHAAGDLMLIKVAEKLKENVREGDVVARLGGDEFGILLKNCPLNKGISIANTISQSINKFEMDWEDQKLSVGISIGVVGINVHDKDFNRILRFADMACYMAKNKGGGQVYLFEDPLSELNTSVSIPSPI